MRACRQEYMGRGGAGRAYGLVTAGDGIGGRRDAGGGIPNRHVGTQVVLPGAERCRVDGTGLLGFA